MPTANKVSAMTKLAAAGTLLALMTGCAGESASSGSSLDEAGRQALAKAQSYVTEAQADVTEVQAVKTQSIAADKSIVVIPCAYAAEGCKRVADAVQEAGKQIGWATRMIDPAGDPEKMRQAVRTAIQLKVSGIVLGALPEALVKEDVEAARAAGIKVVNLMEPNTATFADAHTGTDNKAAGRMDAALLAVETGGLGNVVTVNDPEFPSVQGWHKGFSEGLAEFCPSCTVVKEMEFQIAGLQTSLPQEFQAVLTANPQVNAVWAAYDPVAAAIAPVIKRSANPDIKVVSHNGDAPALNSIKSGKESLIGTVGYPIEWIGYNAVDQMNRLLTGTIDEKTRTATVPNKLLTSSNITSVPWNGDVDWKAAYLQSWNAAK